MARFDLNKTFSETTESIRQLRAFNPFTIHKKGTRAKAIFALSLVCFFWGTTWLASKEGVKHMPALQLVGIRQLIGGALYVLFFLYKGVKWPKGNEWTVILILAFLNFILSNGLSTWGVKFISAGLGSIIGAIFPLWLVIIGLFSKDSRIPPQAILGLVLGFAGVCVIFVEHFDDFFDKKFSFGILLSIIATWTWAFGTLYTKKKAASFNPYFSLGLQMLISGITLTLFTGLFTTDKLQAAVPITSIPWQSWAAIAYLVIFGSIIAFIAYLYALQNLPTEQASVYAYINPVVAVLLGAIIFNEKLTIFISVGGITALLGVYMVNRAYRIVPARQPEAEGV
jgi:drug/metabolite transporter (DMT)-like permease